MNIDQRAYLYIWMHKHRYDFCMYVSICLTNVCCFSESLYLRLLLSLYGSRSKHWARQDMPPEMVGLKTVLMPQKAVPWLDTAVVLLESAFSIFQPTNFISFGNCSCWVHWGSYDETAIGTLPTDQTVEGLDEETDFHSRTQDTSLASTSSLGMNLRMGWDGLL